MVSPNGYCLFLDCLFLVCLSGIFHFRYLHSTVQKGFQKCGWNLLSLHPCTHLPKQVLWTRGQAGLSGNVEAWVRRAQHQSSWGSWPWIPKGQDRHPRRVLWQLFYLRIHQHQEYWHARPEDGDACLQLVNPEDGFACWLHSLSSSYRERT